MAVVTVVSLRDGQVTLRVSSRTSWRNLNGDVAIQLNPDSLILFQQFTHVVAASGFFAQAGRNLHAG
jgi:hypothetical protein